MTEHSNGCRQTRRYRSIITVITISFVDPNQEKTCKSSDYSVLLFLTLKSET
jgi:hypothetical protein